MEESSQCGFQQVTANGAIDGWSKGDTFLSEGIQDRFPKSAGFDRKWK